MSVAVDDPGLRDELLALGTATLYEAGGLDLDLDPAIGPAWPGAEVCGPAHTVHCGPADNLALHRALVEPPRGAVLVADGHGIACGYWGEVLASAAARAGLAGLVIDGGVRDVARLAELRFAAFSRMIAVRRTSKQAPGEIGQPIVVGGRTVAAGDLVVGDADGVLVIPAARLQTTLAAARARATKEAAILDRIAAGETTLDLYGLRDAAVDSNDSNVI